MKVEDRGTKVSFTHEHFEAVGLLCEIHSWLQRLTDWRPILHLARNRVEERAISGNKCGVLLLLQNFVRAVRVLK